MSSLISILALCILVLSNGCFTLPVVNQQIPSSTYTPINDDVTTGETINLRLVADDDDKTILPNIESLRSIDEHIGFEETTSSVNLSGNKFIKALRAFDEYSTPESMITTTGESNTDKREFNDLPFATVEPIDEADEVNRRSIVNEFENVTQILPVETTTATINTTLPLISTTIVPEITTSETLTSTIVVPKIIASEPFTSTTVVPEITTSEPLTSTTVVPKVTTSEPFTSTIVVPKITTSEPLTSTVVVPKITTSEPFTSTSSSSSSSSTEKYIGHLKDETKYDEEYEPSTKSTKIQRKSGVSTTTKPKINLEDESEEYEPSTKSTKIQRKSSVTSTKKPKINLEDESEEYEPSTKSTKLQRKSGVTSTKKSKINVEDKSEEKEEYPKESIAPIAVFDQQALDKVPNVPNDFLVLDENNDLVVTGLPNQTFTTAKADKNEEEAKPLNQGSTLLLFLLAALLFCACILASTLAFVRNRHTLKRKSRIIEMEAHLDQNYYYHPFMFQQQHHEK